MRADRVMAAEGGKRIDLGAPLRSVRHADAPPPYRKADLNSGPIRHPGAVPFVWEQRPGQPKSVRTRRAPPSSPSHASSQARPSVEEADASPYHDALGDLTPRRVPADWSRDGVAGRKVEPEAVAPEAVPAAAAKERGDDGDDDERFSDALDTLSRTESFTVNCSVSGLSGAPDPAPRVSAGAADPGARGFMMDRFLPAAQAVAVGSPQYTFRKAGATGNSGRDHARTAAVNARRGSDDDSLRRTPVQLPYQHLPPNYLSCSYPRREEHGDEEEDEDDDYDVASARGFASKGCGLLPALCAKSSMLLLNPVPAMKRGKARASKGLPSKGRGQKPPSPLARSSQNKHLGSDSNGPSWEDVYKHKLGQKYIHQGEDGRSKLTSESNQLTFWSDSPTGDDSSPFHSIAGGTSPYRRNILVSPPGKANGSFGRGDKEEKMSRSNGYSSLGRDPDRGSLVGSDHISLKGSSSMSSGLELDRTGHEDSMDHRGDIGSETSHLAVLLDSKASLNARADNTHLEGQKTVGRNPIGKGQENDVPTERISEMTKSTRLVPSGKPDSVKFDDGKTFTDDTSQNVPFHLEDSSVVEKKPMPLQYLLLLPVPKSPSESWLSRNLLTVTNKPPVTSFFGIQAQSKRQATWTPTHPNNKDLKPSRPRQIRFADVVERPDYLDSEI